MGQSIILPDRVVDCPCYIVPSQYDKYIAFFFCKKKGYGEYKTVRAIIFEKGPKIIKIGRRGCLRSCNCGRGC